MRYRRNNIFSLDQYIAQWFPDASRSGDERVIPCPFVVPETGEICGRPKLYVTCRVPVRFHCFRCDAGRGLAGDAAVVAFLMAHLGVSDAEAAKILDGGEYDAPVSTYDSVRVRRLVAAPVPLPAASSLEYRLLPYDSVLGGEAWVYLMGRGVTPEQVATHRIGVAMCGRLAGRVILPIFRNGAMVYYVARAIGAETPKYLNPINSEMSSTASEVIANLDVAILYGHVRLVEGYFDMLAQAPTGAALLGKTLSTAQLDLLAAVKRERPLLTASVMLDGDGTVSRAHALRIAGQLEAAGFRGVTVEIPDGDPGDQRGTREVVPYSLAALVAARVGA